MNRFTIMFLETINCNNLVKRIHDILDTKSTKDFQLHLKKSLLSMITTLTEELIDNIDFWHSLETPAEIWDVNKAFVTDA